MMMRFAVTAGFAYLAGRFIAPRLSAGEPSMGLRLGAAAALGLAVWLAYLPVVEGQPMSLGMGDDSDCGCGG